MRRFVWAVVLGVVIGSGVQLWGCTAAAVALDQQRLNVSDVQPVMDAVERVLHAADVNGDGVITGALEWARFFDSFSLEVMQLAAPPKTE